MSTRALRKLQNNKDLELSKATREDPDDGRLSESGETEGVENDDLDVNLNSKSSGARSKSTNEAAQHNIFALLCDDEDQEQEDEEAVAEKKMTVSAKSKKKKKKSKQKAKENTDENHRKEEEDEIDASVRYVDQLLAGRQSAVRIQTGARSHEDFGPARKSVLSIEHRNLNPDNEIKRIFGSKVIEQDKPQRRQRSHPIRKTWLVQPKAGWQTISKTGLSMRLVETVDGLHHFTFEHSRSYQKAQFEFLDAVESLHPENVINIVKLYPFHIDALMQVSEIYKMSEDMQGAAEMIERVLYVFEMSFHPLFSLTNGRSRLSYRHNENRSFFLALFHHLVSVGRRGCWRTALEFCKLLLSLSPDDDPLCVLLMIDFYAIRSEQFGFLWRLFEEWDSHRNLSLLPNFAFSVPLALFHMSTVGEAELEKADEMLQRSLIMFPGVLFPLLDKCSIAPDSAVQGHGFFTSKALTSHLTELQQLIQLYVGRNHSSWKEPGVIHWMERNVRRVLERVDDKDPLVEQCATKRNAMYRGTPRNVYRHILISDIKESMSSLPPDVRLSPILSYDPLPPIDAISSYERPPRQPRTTQQLGSPLSAFFRSLLPSFDPREPAVEEVEGAVGGRPEGADLRQGIGALVDAMRNLLDGIRFAPHPLENGGAENGARGADEENDDPAEGNDDEWD